MVATPMERRPTNAWSCSGCDEGTAGFVHKGTSWNTAQISFQLADLD